MKLYDPKKKDSFVMQFGFPYPESVHKRKKKLIKTPKGNEVFCAN